MRYLGAENDESGSIKELTGCFLLPGTVSEEPYIYISASTIVYLWMKMEMEMGCWIGQDAEFSIQDTMDHGVELQTRISSREKLLRTSG